MDCFEYFEAKGFTEIEDLSEFITNFIDDPSVFYELTSDERMVVERQMDKALTLLDC
jgi:hypothetical protein